jgi:hypothetical protein
VLGVKTLGGSEYADPVPYLVFQETKQWVVSVLARKFYLSTKPT